MVECLSCGAHVTTNVSGIRPWYWTRLGHLSLGCPIGHVIALLFLQRQSLPLIFFPNMAPPSFQRGCHNWITLCLAYSCTTRRSTCNFSAVTRITPCLLSGCRHDLTCIGRTLTIGPVSWTEVWPPSFLFRCCLWLGFASFPEQTPWPPPCHLSLQTRARPPSVLFRCRLQFGHACFPSSTPWPPPCHLALLTRTRPRHPPHGK